jgi:hypothetical protein
MREDIHDSAICLQECYSGCTVPGAACTGHVYTKGAQRLWRVMVGHNSGNEKRHLPTAGAV